MKNDLHLRKNLDYLAGFEKRIGYTFTNKVLLVQAFTHPSYTFNTWTGKNDII